MTSIAATATRSFAFDFGEVAVGTAPEAAAGLNPKETGTAVTGAEGLEPGGIGGITAAALAEDDVGRVGGAACIGGAAGAEEDAGGSTGACPELEVGTAA